MNTLESHQLPQTHTHTYWHKDVGSWKQKEQEIHIKLQQEKIRLGQNAQKCSLPRYSMPESVIECHVFAALFKVLFRLHRKDHTRGENKTAPYFHSRQSCENIKDSHKLI